MHEHRGVSTRAEAALDARRPSRGEAEEAEPQEQCRSRLGNHVIRGELYERDVKRVAIRQRNEVELQASNSSEVHVRIVDTAVADCEQPFRNEAPAVIDKEFEIVAIGKGHQWAVVFVVEDATFERDQA